MKGPIRWGVILGAAVAVLSLVFGLVGWHRTYEMSFVFLAVAILTNLATVILCLREQASSQNWLGQVKNGLIEMGSNSLDFRLISSASSMRPTASRTSA